MNAAAGGTSGSRAAAEVRSQPEIWAVSMDDIEGQAARGLPDMGRFAEVIFTGCGSTSYLSQWAAAHTRALLGVPATAVPASELLLSIDAWVLRSPVLLVAISRSAKTTETVRAVDAFRERGLGEVTVVTCAPDEVLGERATWVLGTPSAMEETVPQTRSFTSMMLAIARIVAGPPDDGVVDGLVREGQRLLAAFGCGIAAEEKGTAYTFLGTGPRYGLAGEAMLKVKEMSLSPAEAFQTLEFRHGPISTVGSRSVVVGLVPDAEAGLETDVLDDVAALGGRTVVLGPRAEQLAGGRHRPVAFDADLAPPWRDVLYLPVVHQTALAIAAAEGLDPDRPSHLQAVVILDE